MYGDAKCTLGVGGGFTVCEIGAVAVGGIVVIGNGFCASDAACEERTCDGAPVHANVGKVG